MSEKFTINHLGAQGDGIGESDGRHFYIPFTLAGEEVLALGSGATKNLVEVLKPSTERISPVCAHFGDCGGCQIQHLEKAAYLEWKLSLLTGALKREGIEFPVDAVLTFEGKRRKAVFSARLGNGGLEFGFLQKNTHDIVEISECPISDASISENLNELKRLIAPLVLGRRIVQTSVLVCDNGLDVAVETPNQPSAAIQKSLTANFPSTGFCRLDVNGDLIAETHRPIIKVGNVDVVPPTGGFVQAVGEAEQAMGSLVMDHLGDCKYVADLFCGMGTFALRLAVQSRVLAIEMDSPSLKSLDMAWRSTGGKLKEVSVEKRDLFLRPLMAAEMKKMEGVVLDPPRSGAELQMKQIARSKVSRVASVSCNPKTFARDLAILVKGGFELVSITALDQFKYTPHLEMVALLVR